MQAKRRTPASVPMTPAKAEKVGKFGGCRPMADGKATRCGENEAERAHPAIS
jgi:hypothetical protein